MFVLPKYLYFMLQTSTQIIIKIYKHLVFFISLLNTTKFLGSFNSLFKSLYIYYFLEIYFYIKKIISLYINY